MSPQPDAVVSTHGLTRRYGATTALDDLTLTVRRGAVTALLGPNGAGKTTFISAVATLLRPDAGTLRVAGIDAIAQPGAVRHVIGLAGQYASVEPAMTGHENLVMVARLFGLGGRSAFAQLGLQNARFIDAGSATHLLTWRGTSANSLLAVLLTSMGFACETFDVGITLTGCSIDDASDVIASIDGCPPIEDLGRFVENLVVEKYDVYVPEDLLRRGWIRRHEPLRESMNQLIGQLSSITPG